jgi:DNA-binding GntR family transcriptional regulator
VADALKRPDPADVDAEAGKAPPTSVVAMLCGEIRQNILTGRYPPGQVLRQEDLAQHYEVSRVPLREAFSKLEAEGYLTLRPRRGYAVSSLNPEEISEIFDLRMLIESHAGQIATKNRTPADIAAIQEIVDAMDALDPAIEDYHHRWCDLNRQFHERLIRPCNRPRLLRLSQQLRDAVEPYIRLKTSLTGFSAAPYSDHGEIVAAFVEGNAEMVAALSAAHCGRAASRLLRLIREADSFPAVESEVGNTTLKARS